MLQLKFSGNAWWELIRYSFFGLIPTGIDVSSLYLLHNYYDWPESIAVAIAFILGTSIAYLLSITIIFRNYIRQKILKEYPTFLSICALGCVFNQIIVSGLSTINWLGNNNEINLWSAKALSIIVVGLYQFTAKKYYLFNRISKH